jgi:hypothetical protein
MVSDEAIRELCVQVVRSRGTDFQLNLLDLLSVLSDHFDAPKDSQNDPSPFVRFLQDALHRPPDA